MNRYEGTTADSQIDLKYAELARFYENDCETIIDRHYQSALIVTRDYENSVRQMRHQQESGDSQDPSDLEKILVAPGNVLSWYLISTEVEVNDLLRSSAEDFTSILSEDDRLLLQKARDNAKAFGVGNQLVAEVLKSASSPAATAAMKAAMDKDVWDKVKINADAFGVGNQLVAEVLKSAYSNDSKYLMTEIISAVSRQNNNDQHNYRYTSYDDFFSKDPRDDNSRDGRSHYTKAPKAKPADEIEDIIQAAILKTDGQRWLETTDRLSVLRVVNTVRAIREKSRVEGLEISDKEIYLRYRRKVDQAEGEALNKEIMESFLVIQALMGGSPKGELPF